MPLAGVGTGGGVKGPCMLDRATVSDRALRTLQRRITRSPGSTVTSWPRFAVKKSTTGPPPLKRLALPGRQPGQGGGGATPPRSRTFSATAKAAGPMHCSRTPAKVEAASTSSGVPASAKPTHPTPTPAGTTTVTALSDHAVTFAETRPRRRREHDLDTGRLRRAELQAVDDHRVARAGAVRVELADALSHARPGRALRPSSTAASAIPRAQAIRSSFSRSMSRSGRSPSRSRSRSRRPPPSTTSRTRRLKASAPIPTPTSARTVSSSNRFPATSAARPTRRNSAVSRRASSSAGSPVAGPKHPRRRRGAAHRGTPDAPTGRRRPRPRRPARATPARIR